MIVDVEVTATFDTMEEAERGAAAMEEAIGKNNGELHQTTIINDEEEED
jgi:hypothetical protein